MKAISFDRKREYLKGLESKRDQIEQQIRRKAEAIGSPVDTRLNGWDGLSLKELLANVILIEEKDTGDKIKCERQSWDII